MLGVVFAAMPAHAVRPDERLADPVLEARARVSKELRCLVCRNQSVDDSDADLAHDLRVLVRERLKEGDTNDRSSPISAPAMAIMCCCARRSSSTPGCCGAGRR